MTVTVVENGNNRSIFDEGSHLKIFEKNSLL